MQTFMTSTNEDRRRAAAETFVMLDSPRLGKQRVEAKQLLFGHFPNHPASKMWQGHRHALCAYGILCCKTWIKRGFDDSLLPEFQMIRHSIMGDEPLVWPWWFGHPAMARTHQTKLFYKGVPRWVAQFNESAPKHSPMRLPYLWPHPTEEGLFQLSKAEIKRGDWEIPSSWSYDHKTGVVIPR